MDDIDPAALREPLHPVTGRTDRRPIVAVVGAALVVLAIAVPKPWTPSRPATAASSGAVPGSATTGAASGEPGDSPAPSATADSYAPLRTICGSPGGWRAATIHRWPNREAPIRTWSAVEPDEATGADDADVPFVDVVASVTALGYCSPRDATAAPDDTAAEFWMLDGEDGAPRRLEPELSEPDELHPLGGLWVAPPEARTVVLGVAAWRPGRYVIRLLGTGFDRWLGIEIREPPGPGSPAPASAAPGSAAPGSPTLPPTASAAPS